MNPVVIDIYSSRMAGNIILENDNLYRLGQINNNEYGDGISICKIDKLTPYLYQETYLNEIKFAKSYGPHTFNIFEDKCVSDFYEIKFNIFSIIYRVTQLLSKLFRKIKQKHEL